MSSLTSVYGQNNYFTDACSQVAEVRVRCGTFFGSKFALMIPTQYVTQTLPPAIEIVSAKITDLTTKYLITPVIVSRTLITAILPGIWVQFKHGICGKINLTAIFIAAAVEEIAFRWLIQTLLLRELPKKIIQAVLPGQVCMVDHNMVKIARITFTSFLFALAHIHYIHLPGLLLPHFAGGLIYSIFREYDYSILELSTYHFIYNAALFAIRGG